MDETSLIAASQQGKTWAFNELVVRYEQLVYSLAYRMLGDGAEAADATQEAFLTAFQHIRELRGSFRAWLLRIATNKCYDQLRARRRRPTVPLESVGLDGSGVEPGIPWEATPEAWALRAETVATIQRGLAALPADQRAAVVLCDVHGLSYEEVAEATGSSLGTVKSRLSRGRARLRDYLRQQGELSASPRRPREGE